MSIVIEDEQVTNESKVDDQVIFGDYHIQIEDINQLAKGSRSACLNTSSDYRQFIEKGSAFIDQVLKEDGVIYGVTTGYGDSCTVTVPTELVKELPIHLTRYHGCGAGAYLDEPMSIAVLAVRLASLSRGYSGVSWDLLKQLEMYINHRIAPVIPEEGSVGASGDLTPLSYVAASLIGEREVYYKGQKTATGTVLQNLAIDPIVLRPKEGLALMNGTAVMTAMACQAFERARYLAQLSTRITAMSVLTLKGNACHFDENLFRVKPHQGQAQVAAWICDDLDYHDHPRNTIRLQDRYSIRCAPHVIGVLMDAMPFFRQTIENEINSSNDNPIIDPIEQQIYHGAHFYGGHIAFVMDSMKNCVANIADLLDRQMALLVDTKFNHGLPRNLTGAQSDRVMLHHGLKALQISVSAWTAEALKNTMPASVFSRSTECHNQDKVSMGTIAARDCIRIIELTEQVVAAMLVTVAQGIQLRIRQQELSDQKLNAPIQNCKSEIFEYFDFIEEDRPLEHTIRQFVNLIRQQYFTLYD